MELPGSTTRLDPAAGAVANGTKLCTVLAAVPRNADCIPVIYGNATNIYNDHGYAEGVDYAATHISETKKPVLFVPLPIATPGVVGRLNQSGNTGTSVVSVAVGSDGSLDEVNGQVRVNTGGTVGTDEISFDLSLDEGRTWKLGIPLSTATSYTIPYIGQVLSFTVGTLVAGDIVLTWHSTAPLWDNTGLTAAKVALEEQLEQSRSWMVIGDLVNSTWAGYITTAANAYETESERYVYAKAQVRDRLPYATMSDVQARMTGGPNVTFADVGAGNDTVTRSSGSFVTDGFTTGDTVRITGAVASGGANNVVGVVTVAAGVLTFPAAGIALVAEGPIAGVAITSEPTLTFADNGASPDTLARNRGSWLDDGFRTGDSIIITGTASNNVTATITNVTATTITVAAGTFAAEVIGTHGVTIVAGESKAQHLAAMKSAFATVTDQKRIDLGFGRGYKLSPFLGFYMRRPVQWADNVRAYQHDVHIATWKKNLGVLDGWSLLDLNNTLVEWDERKDAGALKAGFTCFRSWGNGPKGAFIARSVTRATPNTVLSATENMAVANVAQTTAQLASEDAIGEDLVLNADNTADPASLATITSKVDSALARNLLANVENEGKRASLASWAPNTDDDLSGVDAMINAVLSLTLKGKVVHINTRVRVNAGS